MRLYGEYLREFEKWRAVREDELVDGSKEKHQHDGNYLYVFNNICRRKEQPSTTLLHMKENWNKRKRLLYWITVCHTYVYKHTPNLIQSRKLEGGASWCLVDTYTPNNMCGVCIVCSVHFHCSHGWFYSLLNNGSRRMSKQRLASCAWKHIEKSAQTDLQWMQHRHTTRIINFWNVQQQQQQ